MRKATANDIVYTKDEIAKWIVEHFKPHGKILDASAGKDAFYNHFDKSNRYRCEIQDGKDFFDWQTPVDWIITNPPYSIFKEFVLHCLTVADNIVLLIPISKIFHSNEVEREIVRFGGLKEIVYMGAGRSVGFPFGFTVGCVYWKRGYAGPCKITHKEFQNVVQKTKL